MKLTTYQNATNFLKRTQIPLESNEAGNSLILGVCQGLTSKPQESETHPCLKTVDEGDTLVIAAMMTPPHKLVLYGHLGDIQLGAEALADNLFAEGWQVPGTCGPGDAPQHFAKRWVKITKNRYELERRLRIYALRAVKNFRPQTGWLREATEEDCTRLSGWWYAFHKDIYGKAEQKDAVNATMRRIAQGDLYVWDDGQPVSMAIKTRPTRNGISISMVYTPPIFRNKGYATACVGALSQLLLDAGWEFCSLFADLANTSSNRVYRRIGYKPVCDYSELLFRNL